MGKKPVGLDIFESNMFWINRRDGSVVQQDKFGRGVPVKLVSSLANPRSLKVLHPYRYNSSLHDPCADPMRCSHICVIVPGHRARCQCPDGQNLSIGNNQFVMRPPRLLWLNLKFVNVKMAEFVILRLLVYVTKISTGPTVKTR